MISSIPSNSANTIAPYVPLGRQPVSQESSDLKSSTFKATEQSADSGRNENRRLPDDRPNNEVEQDRVSRGTNTRDDLQAEKERQLAEQDQIAELSARDREVRAHEQAHAAVAGQHGGSPMYTFQRGPNGVSYAVEGEVAIDTSPIPGNPEATIQKAQQLRRAANAPADPSGQDRQVAAQAAKMEQDARAELREQQAIESEQETREVGRTPEQQQAGAARAEEARRIQEEEEQVRREEQQFADEQLQLDQRRARAELFGDMSQRNIDINRRLVEIGVVESPVNVGSFFNQTV